MSDKNNLNHTAAPMFSRRVLLAVTGLTPQVITETLYALMKSGEDMPTEVRIITTEHGRNRAVRDLLAPEDGKFHRFCKDYGLEGAIRFTEKDITVITGENGEPLPDIRTPQESERAADTIMNAVRELCSDTECSLHVSIAGGRKSMGFLVGYALSIFGREQDRLSHVLVSEPFENNRDFFFPPASEQNIFDKDGSVLDPRKAIITLADLPFIRMRTGVTEDLLKFSYSFLDTVRQAQSLVAPEKTLVFNLSRHEVFCAGKPVSLPITLYAIYFWFARLQQEGRLPMRPERDVCASDFLSASRKVIDPESKTFSNMHRAIRSDNDFLDYIQKKRTKINNQIKKELGRMAGPYEIASIGTHNNTQYTLAIPASCIDIRSTSA